MSLPDPKLVPNEAIRAGTVGLVNRSRQYSRADAGELLRSLNEAWTKIRLLESSIARKEVELAMLHTRVARYRGGLIALTSIVTGLAWEGVKYLAPIALKWLGVA